MIFQFKKIAFLKTTSSIFQSLSFNFSIEVCVYNIPGNWDDMNVATNK
jgi:hypothetical protein